MTVCQLQSVSQLSLEIQLGDKPVRAIVDSAAQVTIISDKQYLTLKRPPKKLRDVTLSTAGRQLSMQGVVAGPVRLKIGNQWYTEEIYVVPIQQDMLLGFDILVHRGKSVLDMAQGTLLFDGQILNLNVDSHQGPPQVARVTVSKRRVIPPNSVVQLKCSIDIEMPDYVIEPIQDVKVLVPRVVRAGGTDPIICVLSPSDRYRVLKKGSHIARADPIEKLISTEAQESPSEIRIVQDTRPVSLDSLNQPPDRIPDHISDRIPVQESHKISDQRSDRIPVQDSDRIPNQDTARIPVQNQTRF